MTRGLYRCYVITFLHEKVLSTGARVKERQTVVVSLDLVRGARAKSAAGSSTSELVAEGAMRADRHGHMTAGRGEWWSLAGAGAAHLLVLLMLWFGFLGSSTVGGAGQHLEAISVELVPSQVLDAVRPSQPDRRTGGTVADLADATGDRDHPADKPKEQQTEKPVEQPTQEQKQSPDAAPIPPKPIERKPEKETAQAKGAIATALVNSSEASASGAAASPGEVSQYALRVREALAHNRPHGLAHKGTTTVAFAIDQNGKLLFARVTYSSGEHSIDEAVLAAMRRTVFPHPPTGMTAQQLSYLVPFNFK
jgi:periplasmic protein TonB